MDSQNQSQEPNSQGHTGLEQLQEFVALCDTQPILMDHPHFTPQSTDTNFNSIGEEKQSADKSPLKNADSVKAPTVQCSEASTLNRLWEEPGVDLREITVTAEERELYSVNRDGLASMATGPTCSVCEEPLNFESLCQGLTCNGCVRP
ncbi:hypothetical protein F5B22DRAFT_646321 [Xylaria bambusicola]|uniref:uncharacterized protein n=1 Tax=Xylaria bambusicola TaxID=326684 RepID=UPI002007C95D|nr:uncharacterized protein F5B22DRAFT_646321 [Xylaria bambusicola]KAI0516973.1 hypothetical protein F5B22DRAFT_646321 [Xylaria bambusicola]